jgi:hypothetical protein
MEGEWGGGQKQIKILEPLTLKKTYRTILSARSISLVSIFEGWYILVCDVRFSEKRID